MFKIFSFCLLCILSSIQIEAVYIKRFTVTDNGGIVFTGNTLGLSKKADKNEPGSLDSAGAFICTDTTQQAGLYPPGTTFEWQKNGSEAFLDLPEGSTVLYAELIWSGSYGFENQIKGNEPDTPVTLLTPQNESYSIQSDPTTRQKAKTPGYQAGNYTRSANVTDYVKGSGTYSVSGVPATISAKDNSHNAAGWTLAVVYQNNQMLTHNMTLFVGCEQASYVLNQPAVVSGFCAPHSGEIHAQIFVSAVEGDTRLMGDRLLFGPTNNLDKDLNALSGKNNPKTNFFCSQINTLYAFTRRAVATKLVGFCFPQLDKRGSFGEHNPNPNTGSIAPGDRQGYDITSVDVTNFITYNQQEAYALGTTTGDDYTINAVGMQIQVGAPIITATKTVNGVSSIESRLGEVVTFEFSFENIGTADAYQLKFKDLLPQGLSLIPGSFQVNNNPQQDPDLVHGFPLGDFLIGQSLEIRFQAKIDSYPIVSNVFTNFGKMDYQFQTCADRTIPVSAETNRVQIILPFQDIPALIPKQLVNSQLSIESEIGDVVTFQIDLENEGQGEAFHSRLTDQIPCGLELIPDSVLVDNIVVHDADFISGVPLGNITSGGKRCVLFQASIAALPENGLRFLNIANVDYQYLEYNHVYANLNTESNSVHINLFLDPSPVLPPLSPLSPSNFKGILKKCKALNKTDYRLEMSWEPPASQNIVEYAIYWRGHLIQVIKADQEAFFEKCLKLKSDCTGFEISARYLENNESAKIPLEITYE